MSKRRTAHSVQLLLKRFRDAELGEPDPFELIGLYDEITRIERKWLMQFEEESERRQPGDYQKLDDWFDRLTRLIERAIRQGNVPGDLIAPLQATLDKCKSRKRLNS